MEFMRGEMGIKIAADRNLRTQITKVRKSIVEPRTKNGCSKIDKSMSSPFRTHLTIVVMCCGSLMASSIPPVQEVCALMVPAVPEYTTTDTGGVNLQL